MESRDTIFNLIKAYLIENSIYKPSVTQRADDDEYPKVVVNFHRNSPAFQDVFAIDLIGRYGLTINIYAKDLDDGTSSIEIADEIESHLYKLLSKDLHMRLDFSKPTPNIDNSIYRITIKYTYTMI